MKQHQSVFLPVLLLMLLSHGNLAAAESVDQPNILFIYTDDQAPWALGNVVQMGLFEEVPAAHTQNIDLLARKGALLVNHFCATPVCSPARAALMTGRYASEFGIYDFIPNPGHKLYNPDYAPGLDTESSTTFAEILQQHGYVTGLVGKWHLGDWEASGDMRFHPTNHGFDYFMGLTSGGTTPENPILEEKGEIQQFKGLTTDILTERALNFIKNNKNHPFLLCLNTRAPHGPWLPVAPEDWIPYADMDPQLPDYPDLDIEKMKKSMREYLASMSGVDRNVGKLFNLLDELDLTGNTIIIFSADNGYNMGHNGIWHKGNGIWVSGPRFTRPTRHGA